MSHDYTNTLNLWLYTYTYMSQRLSHIMHIWYIVLCIKYNYIYIWYMYILYMYSLKCPMLKLCIPIRHKHQPLEPKHHQTLRHVPPWIHEKWSWQNGKIPCNSGNIIAYIMAGLWFEPTPLKNHGVRQLGWLFHSQYDGKVNPNSMVPNNQPDIQYISVLK